jgi:glycosyltransferase involved in cell wall biosynthesis
MEKLALAGRPCYQSNACMKNNSSASNEGRCPVTIAVMLRHVVNPGGVTVYTDNVLRNILKLDQRNRYILLLPDKSLLGRYPNSGNVTEIVIETTNGLANRIIWDQVKVLKHLAPHNVDVIYNPKLSVPLGAGCKTLFTMHGLEQFAARRHFLWYDRIYFSAAMRFYCAKADAILVMTETGGRDLQKYLRVPPEKIHVINESYNERCHRIGDSTELQRVKSKLNLPGRFILFVGGIAPLKNIPALLKAFQILKARQCPHKLVLAGFKRFRFAEDMALVKSLGLENDTIETGFVDDEDIPALYSLADCFVLPSFYEGFGLPILEAQACGCPVVISNRGAMPEVAGNGGALAFDPDSPSALAGRIQQIIDDQTIRQRLVKYGFENVKKYSWAKTARKTIEVFEALGGALMSNERETA